MSAPEYIAGLRRLINNAQVMMSNLRDTGVILDAMNGEAVMLGLQSSNNMEMAMLIQTHRLLEGHILKAEFLIEQYINTVESYIRQIGG